MSDHPQMVYLRDFGVGRPDLTPQNSIMLFLRVKSVIRLACTELVEVNSHNPASAGLDEH
jgi:hypothetical protein